uniref:Uncharacterized protein n=1 Tax=Wuchereria bancrofti TaxID=6293 RepID=A0AAF5Q741_WUCBA
SGIVSAFAGLATIKHNSKAWSTGWTGG